MHVHEVLVYHLVKLARLKSVVRFLFCFVCLFDLILYVPPTIFQLYRDGSSWVEPGARIVTRINVSSSRTTAQ